MSDAHRIGIRLIIMLSTVFSQTDISFKFGLPFLSAQLLLNERTVGGIKIAPTIRTGYFHIGQSVKGGERRISRCTLICSECWYKSWT